MALGKLAHLVSRVALPASETPADAFLPQPGTQRELAGITRNRGPGGSDIVLAERTLRCRVGTLAQHPIHGLLENAVGMGAGKQ